MICQHCGAQMSKHAKTCPECGAPRDLPVDEKTTVLTHEPDAYPQVEVDEKTVRMPQTPPAEPAPAPAPALEPEFAPEPEPHKSSPLPAILAVAAVALVVALFVLKPWDRPASEPTQTDPTAASTEELAEATEQGEAPVSPVNTRANGPDEEGTSDDQNEAEVSPVNTRANGSDEVSQATLDEWSSTACAALGIYPSNHVLEDDSDKPAELPLESWANELMQYVDSSSPLGQALLADPESVATPLGYFEAASYVSSTEVTEASADGVSVTVTLEATQVDWSATSTVTEQYLVKFNDSGLITDIVSVG